MPQPQMCDPLFYYPYGNMDTPQAAFATAVFSEDLVNLSVWEVNRWVPMNAISRAGCTAINNNPTLATKQGCWEDRVTAHKRTMAIKDAQEKARREQEDAAKSRRAADEAEKAKASSKADAKTAS